MVLGVPILKHFRVTSKCCTLVWLSWFPEQCSRKEVTGIIYRISSVIRQRFFSFQNNPKDLDPSCKMDLELWDCLGRVKLVLHV